MKENQARSLAKGVSWRLVGTLDTILISFLLTGEVMIAAKIGGLELITKFILYYFHERAWNEINWGRVIERREKISLAALVAISEEAGEVIMDIYNRPETIEVVNKEDRSPLTEADQASNRLIVDRLRALYPDIPVVSEEEKNLPYEDRRNWPLCWQVDPLDGTKEFIRRNGEFCVNIALLYQGRAIAGVIHAPAQQLSAWAEQGHGAFLKEAGKPVERLRSRKPGKGEKLAVVASRSHMSPEVETFVSKLPEHEIKSAGSALKFLLVARGEAHIYPRLAPTMEWDTSAGQIIVEEAGGELLHADTRQPLEYNKEDLLNPHFLTYGKGVREMLEA